MSKLPEQDLIDRIFTVSEKKFENITLEVFQFQYRNNPLYQSFCKSLYCNANSIKHIKQIPFLTIEFFKTHQLKTTSFQPELTFESSGTTGVNTAQHFIKHASIYQQSYLKTFSAFYGDPSSFCMLALLPSYLERKNSSLVYMMNDLINKSGNASSGFFLHDTEKLHQLILQNEAKKQPVILLGVTYALIDFAIKYPMTLKYTQVIETGGMKGRKEELTCDEVQSILKKQFNTHQIHSEYGMTELLSQAYSSSKGIFKTPPWMKIIMRAEDDPFDLTVTTGAINIIDLANIYSCAFIATSDAGKLYPDETFEITGRLDNSDIRGCALMSI